MSLFKLLFWIFIIYIISRLIKFSFFIGKIQNQAKQKYSAPEQEQKKEGTTTIKYIPEKDVKPQNTSSKKDDDYIDYEEVK
jgi:hypothetical protein